MPTVLRINGFSFVIYLNDHEPSHVHVFKQGEVVISLGNSPSEIVVRQNNRMSANDERRALRIASEHHDMLLEKWREING